MRTACIIAETHEGTERLLCGRRVPIHTQIAEFRKFRLITPRVHREFAIVTFQDSDGAVNSVRFMPAELPQKYKTEKGKA